MDSRLPHALPAPVELGLGLYSHRSGPPRHGTRRRRDPDPAGVPVEERQDPAHRLQPRCASARATSLVPSTGRAPPIPLTPRPDLPLPAASASLRCTRSRPGAYSRSPRRRGEGVAEAREFLGEVYPKLLAWHRYLATARDPEGSGLVTIYHPWESGTDNSPRWTPRWSGSRSGRYPTTSAWTWITSPTPPSGRRATSTTDLSGWSRSSSTPAATTPFFTATSPFLAKDVLASAILVRANEALLDVAESRRCPGRGSGDDPGLDRSRARRTRGTLGPWAGPLPRLRSARRRITRGTHHRGIRTTHSRHRMREPTRDPPKGLRIARFHGQPRPAQTAPPSTSPDDTGFLPRSYWRGPVWPVMNWLLWWSLERLRRTQESGLAQGLRPRATLRRTLWGVLRALHRRGAGLGRSVVDCGRGPRLAGGRGA